jgi:Ca2+/Na+ antiporter
MNLRATKQLTKLPNPNCIGSTLLAALILVGIMLIQISVAVHNQTSAAAASKSRGMESSKSQLHMGP